jgi:hypothetical protein
MSSNQRPDTLMQDRISQVDEKLLQRTAGPYIGSLGPCARARMFPSAGCGHGGALCQEETHALRKNGERFRRHQ